MTTTALTVVTLEPARVAIAWEFGERPEQAAWDKLRSWAAARGLLAPETSRIFGFNNPNPSAGSPSYGYEYQLEVAPDVAPGDGVQIGERPGGRYAVLPFAGPIGDPYVTIPEAWRRLDALAAEAGYRQGAHQWLEQHNAEGQLVALYYPLAG